MTPFGIEIHEEHRDAIRVALTGELDLASAPRLSEELSRLDARRPPLLLLDLRELRFMDSTGLRLVVGADERARDQGRRLVVVRGPAAVDRIFSVTRLDTRLELVDDPGAALPAG